MLQDGTASRGLLDEARIMASVLHPCCVHVLAVCLASQVMLVTPLMPLGCLLDYVRKHRANVGSKALLNWCAQIARVSCELVIHCYDSILERISRNLAAVERGDCFDTLLDCLSAFR